ncbi:MAG: CDP-diacylglycerol--serine O-phosphatidyltransferase [Phycisphaeraceae bacterium]
MVRLSEKPKAAKGRPVSRAGARRRRVARRTVATVPTLFTLGNALCGFASIFAASRPATPGEENWALTVAAMFIFAGMVFDGLDGMVARLTRSASGLGEQLDSMADMVTFGVAPAFLAVQLVGVGVPFVPPETELFDRVAIVIAFIYVACAALRLARFNLELHSQSDHNRFSGLPSPGAAGTVASLALLHEHFLIEEQVPHWAESGAAGAMVAIMLLAALAMVSNLRYVHVMNRYVRGRAPINTLAKAVIVGLLLVVQPQEALAGVFVLYALSAPVASAARRLRKAGHGDPGGEETPEAG